MSPEEFYRVNKLKLNKEVLFEMRVKSLDWMLGCYHKGTIRRRTIINLIPLANLYEVLYFMEERERYEDCHIVKKVIDEIYEQTKFNNNKIDMSKKRQKEIIELFKKYLSSPLYAFGGAASPSIVSKDEKELYWRKTFNPKKVLS